MKKSRIEGPFAKNKPGRKDRVLGAYKVHLTLTISHDLVRFIKPKPLKILYLPEIISAETQIGTLNFGTND